jgi:hypothetical protein
VLERKLGVIGVIEHLDNGEDGESERKYSFLLGANAFSSKGELVVEVAVDNVHGVVIGVIGRNEKLFEDDFAGVIVVEGRMFPGSRVILNGKGLNTFSEVSERKFLFVVSGTVATVAGEMVRNVSPTEIVVL